MIFNPDDTGAKRDDLPEKFSELRDSDFPLFLTMDTVNAAHPMNVTCANVVCARVCSSLAFWRLIRNPRQAHPGAEICNRKRRNMNGTVARSW
jgi:hypothetical protein